MLKTTVLRIGPAAIGFAFVLAVEISARQQAGTAIRVDNDDVGGVVAGANGPEAGV